MLNSLLFVRAASQQIQGRTQSGLGSEALRRVSDTDRQTGLLQSDVERLFMLTEALWTILKEQHGYTDEDLAERVREIDLRDGRLDGRSAQDKVNPDCPQCGRKLIGRNQVCLYCGTEASRDPFQR